MELELGLALPNPSSHKSKALDLNNHFQTTPPSPISTTCFNHGNKRDFLEAFQITTRTLPLLWNDQPDDDDGDGDETQQKNQDSLKKNPAVVGWPPIKSSWRKLLQQQRGGVCSDESPNGGGVVVGDDVLSSSMYVKVKMEGVAIGRKVDLNLHRSYDTLTATLDCMFGKYQKSSGVDEGEDQSIYKLTYEDQDGDWMLVGDVPWETFVKSVKRLKIHKGST